MCVQKDYFIEITPMSTPRLLTVTYCIKMTTVNNLGHSCAGGYGSYEVRVLGSYSYNQLSSHIKNNTTVATVPGVLVLELVSQRWPPQPSLW